MQPKNFSFTVIFDEDPENGDLMMPLPDEVIEAYKLYDGMKCKASLQDGNIVIELPREHS